MSMFMEPLSVDHTDRLELNFRKIDGNDAVSYTRNRSSQPRGIGYTEPSKSRELFGFNLIRAMFSLKRVCGYAAMRLCPCMFSQRVHVRASSMCKHFGKRCTDTLREESD